jgi:hypothetical protein
MALSKSASAPAAAPAFEAMDDDTATTVQSAAATPTAAPAPAATTEVAVQKSSALAVARPNAVAVVKQNVLSGMKDAFRVEFDSLPRILASQGSFQFKDTEEDLGDQVQMQLMSYQDSWTCGPNDTKADAELVKYADNPDTANDGTDLKAHLDDLKAQGYSKASIAHRCVIVGELISSNGKVASDRTGELVQMDLPESGRRSFNTYQLQASYAVGKGRKTAEEAALLTIKAVKEKSKAGEMYTKTVFA